MTGGEGAGECQWPTRPPGRVENHGKANEKWRFSGMGAAASSARRLRVLREVFGEVPELILESPEVPLEPLGVILGHPGSIRSSGFWFPGLFGIQNCQPSSFWQQRKSF